MVGTRWVQQQAVGGAGEGRGGWKGGAPLFQRRGSTQEVGVAGVAAVVQPRLSNTIGGGGMQLGVCLLTSLAVC
jgi:hypothetical protein